MPRVQGHILSQEDFPCGRLVAMEANYDAGEKIMEFIVPSGSRGRRVYAVEVDALTGEVGCACEAFRDFREAHKMPYRLEVQGRYPEQLAKLHDKKLLPLITREPKGLCPHAKKVRLWIKRKGLLSHFEEREKWLIQLLEQKGLQVA